MNTNHADKAATFRSLHHGARPLALCNVWDIASAMVAEAAGAEAIATTSAGVSWALGAADGDHLDRARAVALVAGITSAVEVPVTADIEGGYADTTKDVADTVRAVGDAGAVGINIEDGQRNPRELAARIEAARRAVDASRSDLFINARTDVFLAGVGTQDQQVTEAAVRARRYVEAGADGIFVPGVVARDTIAALTSQIAVPVNVMAGPGALSVSDLAECGVARVSLGSSVAQAAYELVRAATAELRLDGTYAAVTAGLDYGELNQLLASAST